jgi:NAD(P)-dependent dehydrogenase (short-subunit alcohol dehydrogenase family)
MVIGATGTIGSAVSALLRKRHDVIQVGHRHGEHQVDLASDASIKALFESISAIDAVICTAGSAKFAGFDELQDADYQLGLRNKLMGQVNVVRIGRHRLKENGSLTLTSGVLGQEPMKGSVSISMVNAALEGFVRAAALELSRGIRVNAVSPPWVTETLQALGMDAGHGMPAAQAAQAYLASVEGTMTGYILDPRKPLSP